MATEALHGSLGSAPPINKRPPFAVDYFNDELPGLNEREREHRRHQFKAIVGFESYSEFVRDFNRRVGNYWPLLQHGPHVPPAVLLAPFLNRDPSFAQHPTRHTKLSPLDEFALPFRKLASLETNAQLAADYDISPGHFDALMLNIATLLAVFWAPDYYLFSDYVQSRGADPSQHVSHLQRHFREGLDKTLFDYLKHTMIRKRRTHEQPQPVGNDIITQQAQAFAAMDINHRQQQSGSGPSEAV